MNFDISDFKEKVLRAAFDDNMTPIDCFYLMNELCVKKPIPFLTVSYPFLARCSYNKPAEVFNHVGRLSYNPFYETIPLQRCNYPKQSVFYGAIGLDNNYSTMMSTAITEVCLEHIKREDIDTHYMTISRWMIKEIMPVFLLPYSPISIKKNPEFALAKKNFDPLLEKMAMDNNLPVEYVTSYLEFMSDMFCMTENKENYYKITSAYVNYIMNYAGSQRQRVDGLIYPSANTQAAGMNIVLHPAVIDMKLVKADVVIMYKARRHPNNPKHFDFVPASEEVQIDSDGNFKFSRIW